MEGKVEENEGKIDEKYGDKRYVESGFI